MKTLKSTRRSVSDRSHKGRPRSAGAAFRSRNGSRRAITRTVPNRSSSIGEAEAPRPDAKYLAAIKNFGLASRAFQRQNYGKAKEIFEKLAQGEVREVAERARVRLQLCQQKLSRPALGPKTAEDYYTLGVAALNARNMDAAIEHLTKVYKREPNQEHVRYALAAAHAVGGNLEGALEHLKAAITLRPANRIQARHDEDFLALASDPRFRQLVYPEAS
jgi:tetratricopeptide (TPR) repeat protein